MFVSFMGHVVLAVVMANAEGCGSADAAPLINPDDVIIVQAVALPKQTTALPELPTRTPDPPAGEPEAAEPPPPPTASDMVIPTKDKTSKGAKRPQRNNRDERAELLKQLKRKALVDESARIGQVDRMRTAEDGVALDDAVLASGLDGVNDPELARWRAAVEAEIKANWAPLPTTIKAHPDYVVIIEVRVAADGSLGKTRVLKGSGDAGFDRSAEIAVAKTGRIPPPPERIRASVARGLEIEFPAKMKL